MNDYSQELQEYQNLHDEIQELENQVRNSRARDLVYLLKSTGGMKGELPNLTKNQYRKLTGKENIPLHVLAKDGKHIRWELAVFDDIATERGYSSGEKLRQAIYDTKQDIERLETLKHDKMILGETLEAAGKQAKDRKLEIERQTMTGKPPVFGDSETKVEKAEIDGMTVTRTRQHPFWQVEADTDGQPPPELKTRVRYAKDAKKLERALIEAHENEVNRDIKSFTTRTPRVSRRMRGISPKVPKLR